MSIFKHLTHGYSQRAVVHNTVIIAGYRKITLEAARKIAIDFSRRKFRERKPHQKLPAHLETRGRPNRNV